MILTLQTWEITYREYTQRQRRGSDRERKILYDLTYMWTIKKMLNSQKQSKLAVASTLEWADWNGIGSRMGMGRCQSKSTDLQL